MQYRVYSGPQGSTDISPHEKSQMLYKEFAALDDALSWPAVWNLAGAFRY
jgi:hypothetical protein